MAEEALQRLIAAVEEYYKTPNTPALLLSRFGQHNKQLVAELRDAFGSLKAAVNAAGAERIRFVDTTVGREAVAPTSVAANLEVQIREEIASQRQASNDFDSLPRSVQIAFCLPTEGGKLIAIDTVQPFQYRRVNAPDQIRTTERIIQDDYRRPGLLLRTASVHDRKTLWRLFLDWTKEVNVDPTIFGRYNAATALERVIETTALVRLIEAQPSDIIERFLIPADIVQILLKHS